MFRSWIMTLLAPMIATNVAEATVRVDPPPVAATDRLQIGVYYFPGWNAGPDGNWKPITAFPERQPLRGWYDSGSKQVMAAQLDDMRRSGIDYVSFDWYWQNDAVHADQSVRAYLAVPQSSVKFSLMWANDKPFTNAQWREIVGFWIGNYFRSPKYLKVGGRPVVSVLTYQGLDKNAKDNGTTVTAYIATAQRMMKAAGLPSIYFVASFDDLSTTLITDDAVKAGFSAVSAYNMHRGIWRGERPGWYKLTQGYDALDKAYRQHWDAAFDGPLDVVVPMISGWDRRPWGGSSDPLHDRSIAGAAQFNRHLIAARATMLQHGSKARLGVICCWNEFGEGSYIEPTKGEGNSKLDQIRRVFGS